MRSVWMDVEETGDEMVVDAEENSSCLKRKERDFSLRAPNNWLLESSSQVHSDTHVTSMSESQHPSTSPCYMNDDGVMVEELTLEKYKISRNSMVSSSLNRQSETQNRPGKKQHLYLGKWQNLFKLRSDLGNGSTPIEDLSKNEEVIKLSEGKEVGNLFLPQFRGQKTMLLCQPNQNLDDSSERFTASDKNKNTMSKETSSPRKTPVSGFSQFFLKNKVKEQAHDSRLSEEVSGTRLDNDFLSPNVVSQVNVVSLVGETSLREWLKPGHHKLNRDENLNIFTQVVKLMDIAHSQQVVLPDVRPSSFKLLPSGRVKYVGLFAKRKALDPVEDDGISYSERHIRRKQYLKQSAHGFVNLGNLCPKHSKINGSLKFIHKEAQNLAAATSTQYNLNLESSCRQIPHSLGLSTAGRQQSTIVSPQLEENWYTSPEELNKRSSTFSSNIYSLGVLLFELFCCFESLEVHAAAMSNLRHRILPPNFLSENSKEAGFCLWLVHPEASSRPTTRDILHSELITKAREVSPTNQVSPNAEDDVESDLLLHFLASLQEKKQEQASNLIKDIGSLEADLEEVEKMHLSRTGSKSLLNVNRERLTKNFSQLENAYFSTRSQIQLSKVSVTRLDTDLLKSRDQWSLLQNEKLEQVMKPKSSDCLGAFFDGLCKYSRFSKFKEIAALKTGDLLNSANVICSMSFDKDQDYFATAGVSKKIKIFEFSSLLNESVDIHYPVVEMSNKSKLSCVCWNSYIKNYLASTDYDGTVQLWDASTGQVFSEYAEHERRAWSVDFSLIDPTKLASGSDDSTVKLWSINEQKSISTIKIIANVCSVQFSSHSSHLLTFGSADYKTYCYDLRNTRIPWCTLVGHSKAVSYVKFLDSDTLVSASTDNTLKLWDLKKTRSNGLSSGACCLTYTGHSNEKNFVGLSVSNGYIACGSESNEVCAYYKSLPMPITLHKFGSTDVISGQETSDSNSQFVSSVCWRGNSDMLVAANSMGTIKLLQMV